MRHGGALSNAQRFTSSWPEKKENPLTEEGTRQVQSAIPGLKKENIDLIFSSDLQRTEETSQMVADVLNLEVSFDSRLREYNFGVFNNCPGDDWHNFFNSEEETIWKRPPGGENKRDIKERMVSFLNEIEVKYENKNILVISHRDPLFVLEGAIRGWSEEDFLKEELKEQRLSTGRYKKIEL